MPKSERTRKPDDANLARRATASDAAATDGSAERPIAAQLNALQGAAGNRAVQRLVRASRAKPQPVQRLGEEDGYNLYQGIAPESSPAAAGAPASAAAPSGYGQYASHLAPETPASPASAAAPSGYGQYAASMAP